MAHGKFGQERRNHVVRHVHRQRHAQHTLYGFAHFVQRPVQQPRFGNNRQRALQVIRARTRQLQPPLAAVKQPQAERVGIKISPLHPYADIAFDNPVATYQYLINELNKLDFAFVEIMQRAPMFPLLPHYPQGDELALFGGMVQGKTVIAGTGFSAETGEAALENGAADLIAYGAAFLANPDLPRRFELGADLNTPDRATMFGGGAAGYIDYPMMD